MTDAPINPVIVDATAVSKSAFRTYEKNFNRLRVANAAYVQARDLSDIFGVDINGVLYDRDSTDVTSADNGITVIVDLLGGRFKRILVGYATGAGGAQTQATSKSTGVTLNALTGKITMNNASLAASTAVSFTLTNSFIGVNDVVVANIVSGATLAAYTLTVSAIAAGSCSLSLRNFTAGPLSDTVVIQFVVLRGAIA